MRVWHFVNEQYGIENIQRRGLNIATLSELNDPFDLLGVNLGDSKLRRSFQVMKNELDKTRGILCFSKSWKNPVQWTHYADRHRGVCLGFDIPDELLCAVSYSQKRLCVEPEKFLDPAILSTEFANKFLATKFSHCAMKTR